MEDSLSVKSNESIATSEEFDFVGEKPGVSKTPTLDFKNGDLNELTNALTEVLQEPGVIMSDLIELEESKQEQTISYENPLQLKDPESTEDSLSQMEEPSSIKPVSSEEECCSEYLYI